MSHHHPDQHRPHFEIESLNTLQNYRGRIPWDQIIAWSSTLNPLDRGAINELLAGDRNTPINTDNFYVRAYLGYLNCLAHDRTGASFQRSFRNTVLNHCQPAAVGRPVHGTVPLFLGIRTEHEFTGKRGQYLNSETVRDFLRFILDASFNDAHHEQTATEFARKDFRRILAQFPFLEELAGQRTITQHAIEHTLAQVSPQNISILIGYLRREITRERAKAGGGISHSQIPQVNDFLQALEEILIQRMSAAILTGDEAKILDRVPQVTHQMFITPVSHAGHDLIATVQHLREIPKPTRAAVPGGARETIRQGFHGLSEISSIFTAVMHFLEMIGLLKQRVQTPGPAAPSATPSAVPSTAQDGSAPASPPAAPTRHP